MMKSLLIVVFLSILSLLNCAQVAPQKKSGPALTFYDIPQELLHVIAEYLKNPFYSLGSMNRYFRDSLSTFPVKPILRKYFDIPPELLTGNGAEIEKELRLLFPLAKLSNPVHFYRALRYEFLNSSKFTALLPHLLNYFDRFEPIINQMIFRHY